MEQGSSGNSASNQDLNALLQYSSSLELPVEKYFSYRNTMANEIQPSSLELLASLKNSQFESQFSRAPFRNEKGESLPQFNEAFQDLPAPYGSSQSHDQLYNIPMMSNVAPGFYSLPSSSRLQGELNGPSQTMVFGSSSINPATQAQKNPSMIENSHLGSIRNQAINPYPIGTNPYPIGTPSGFDFGSSSSSVAKDPTSALKRKATWEDDATPAYPNWTSFSQGYQRFSTRSFDAIGGRYTLYDKRYEDIGLPVDPHLRIFNATNGNGNGESSTQKN